MRILHICSYTWAIGGPARTIYDYSAEALKQGHQVVILSPVSPDDSLYPAPAGAAVVPCLRSTPLSKVYREFSIEMFSYLRKHLRNFDIVHIHGIWHFGSLAPYLFSPRPKTIVTIHGLLDTWAINHGKWKKRVVSLLFQKRLLSRADVIHVLNQEERQDILRYLGYNPGNIIQIPNGINLADFESLPERRLARKEFVIQDADKVVLFMGRLNEKKGLDLLLPAFAGYQSTHPEAVLLLAGPDDGYLSAVEAFRNERGMDNSLRVVGMLTGERKLAALAAADVFVLPSYSEGFSIAVLEAMAAKVPCLISDRVGFNETIEKYQAAEVVALTQESVRRGLDALLGNADERKAKAARAFGMVRDHFQISSVAHRMLGAYATLLD